MRMKISMKKQKWISKGKKLRAESILQLKSQAVDTVDKARIKATTACEMPIAEPAKLELTEFEIAIEMKDTKTVLEVRQMPFSNTKTEKVA